MIGSIKITWTKLKVQACSCSTYQLRSTSVGICSEQIIYNMLFVSCKCGSSGTTAAALLAGIPQVSSCSTIFFLCNVFRLEMCSSLLMKYISCNNEDK